jgi:hypothetical protein
MVSLYRFANWMTFCSYGGYYQLFQTQRALKHSGFVSWRFLKQLFFQMLVHGSSANVPISLLLVSP